MSDAVHIMDDMIDNVMIKNKKFMKSYSNAHCVVNIHLF